MESVFIIVIIIIIIIITTTTITTNNPIFVIIIIIITTTTITTNNPIIAIIIIIITTTTITTNNPITTIYIIIILYAGVFDQGVSCDQHGICARGGPFCIHPGTQLLWQTGRSAGSVDFPAAHPRLGLLPQKGAQSTLNCYILSNHESVVLATTHRSKIDIKIKSITVVTLMLVVLLIRPKLGDPL